MKHLSFLPYFIDLLKTFNQMTSNIKERMLKLVIDNTFLGQCWFKKAVELTSLLLYCMQVYMVLSSLNLLWLLIKMHISECLEC